MLVSVTGGTGFVGAHSVAAIVRAGHRVRLLVRDERRVGAALGPLGVDRAAVEVVTGDVTDGTAVAAALRGADAVLHAAGVYSFDSRRHRTLAEVNERGTAVVLDAARRAGVQRTVHVSTFGALLPPSRGRALSADSPVGRPREAYLASKAAAEAIARQHQDSGAPVVITYPPALLGPEDPHLGDQNARLRNVLRGLMPIWPLGGFPVGDVRDTAELHLALLSGVPGRRVFGPGRYVSTREYVGTLRRITGRPLPTAFVPASAVLPVGWFADRLQHVWPWRLPVEYGAVYVAARAARIEENAPRTGVSPRPLERTVRDAVRWLHAAGHLSDRQAGDQRAASAESGKRR